MLKGLFFTLVGGFYIVMAVRCVLEAVKIFDKEDGRKTQDKPLKFEEKKYVEVEEKDLSEQDLKMIQEIFNRNNAKTGKYIRMVPQ